MNAGKRGKKNAESTARRECESSAVNVDYIKRKGAFQGNDAEFCEITLFEREKTAFDFLKTAPIMFFDYLKNVARKAKKRPRREKRGFLPLRKSLNDGVSEECANR